VDVGQLHLFPDFSAAAQSPHTGTANLNSSTPDSSDLDRFSVALQVSREQVGALYERSVGSAEREHHAQLLAALQDLSTAEEELRAQHEAIGETQRELDIQRRRYRTLFEFAPDPYIVTDEHGIIEDANDALTGLLGLSTQHVIGKSLDSFIGPHTRRELDARLRELPRGKRMDKRELVVKAPDGKAVPVEATLSVLESASGGRTSFCWLLRDISLRQETEDSMLALNRSLNARVAQRTRELELALEGEQAARKDAETANRIKTELFARLSHEFRTPLHAVSGYLEILQQNIHGGLTREQRRDVERIHQAQEHLMALVNMILDFAKLEAGPIELSMAEIPIEETLIGAEALVFPQFDKKRIVYTHRAGDPAITVFADREKVQQIVVNLLANAMKFTPAGGSVELDWRIEEESLLVRVRDTGPGIPPDKIDQIFEPFVQLRSVGSVPTGGTGLGLPISRDLARAMGGDVGAASTFGVGSTFTLTLPLRKRASSKLSASKTAG
jgi:PAS domain S-box-containing protein